MVVPIPWPHRRQRERRWELHAPVGHILFVSLEQCKSTAAAPFELVEGLALRRAGTKWLHRQRVNEGCWARKGAHAPPGVTKP